MCKDVQGLLDIVAHRPDTKLILPTDLFGTLDCLVLTHCGRQLLRTQRRGKCNGIKVIECHCTECIDTGTIIIDLKQIGTAA